MPTIQFLSMKWLNYSQINRLFDIISLRVLEHYKNRSLSLGLWFLVATAQDSFIWQSINKCVNIW